MNDWTQCVVSPAISLDGFDSLATPVYRASTIPFANAQSYATRLDRGEEGYSYGMYGTPTTRTLERKISILEQGVRTFLVPSGQAAVTLSMLFLLSQGGQVLIPDTVYPPARDFADKDLARYGVEAIYYDPLDIDALQALICSKTRLIWIESPGSTTMEVQDLPRIAKLAHQHGALVGCDNTWATPLCFKPLAHGADIVVEALTKYFSGHSDVLMGSITVRDPKLASGLRGMLGRYGIGVSPDDCSLVLRGIETMAVRLNHSAAMTAKLLPLITRQATVRQVLYPALPDSAGHEIWSRDFQGASGVFSVVFTDAASPHVATALDVFKTFVIGASWGGTRSLAAPMAVARHRTVNAWPGQDVILRLSIGLEAESDLKQDLDAFFECLNQKCAKTHTAREST